MAIIGWYSRYVLAWRLSNTLDVGFFLETLDEALLRRQLRYTGRAGSSPEVMRDDTTEGKRINTRPQQQQKRPP